MKRVLDTDSISEMFNQDGDEIYDSHQKLSKIYEHICHMPTWPYDVKMLSTFCSTMIVPLLIFAREIMTNPDNILSAFLKIFSRD